MNLIIIILLTILIIVAIICMIYITLYNKLLFYKIRIEKAEEVIIEELKTRFNLIKNSKKTIEKNTKKDLTIFSDLEKVKKSNVSSYELEKKITESIATIYVIKNDYPKIMEKKEFKDIIRKLEESDTKLNAAKSFYNQNNSKLIALLKSFPANVIALINGIKIQPYYDTIEVFNENDDGMKI